jgi:DNA-binding transcriptional regulator YhcF (GntR family)
MGKSLTETARAVLTEGQVPSVSASDNNPDRDAQASNPNRASLKPKSKYAEADPKKNDADDLGGATPTSTAKENLGAKASGGVSKDKSKSGIPKVGPEQRKSLHEDEELDEDVIEIDEEMEEIIAEMIDAGMSEDEIADTIAEAMEEEALEEAGPNKWPKPKKRKSEEETRRIIKTTTGYDKDAKKDKNKKLEEDTDDVELSEELESFIEQCIEEGMDDDSIEAAIAENFELVEDYDDEASIEEVASEIKTRIMEEPIDMKEDVDALLSGESLSEEFQTKAATIFESAVKNRLVEEIDILEQAYQASLNETVAAVRNELSEQVDDYLNYVIENWISENEVAIQSGLRNELVEDFIAGLRNLFAEHYIDIPEEQVSVVEALGEKVDELTARLNEEIENNVMLVKQIDEAVKFEVLVGAFDGLTSTQAEKLKTLAEGVEYTSPEEYSAKVQTLKENYFPTKVNSTGALDQAESNGPGMIAEEVQGRMGAYVKVLGKSLPK